VIVDDMSRWGLSDEELADVLANVRILSSHDMVDLKPVFNKLEKSVESLNKSMIDYLTLYTELPDFYRSKEEVAASIVMVDQARKSLASLPEVFMERVGERLPKKGITPKTNLVVYLASVYEENTGRKPSISTHTYEYGHPLYGDFVDFLNAILKLAGVSVPALARHAKQILQAR